MLTEFRDVFEKINRERVAIGYDLNEEYAQISFCSTASENPETLSTVAGEEQYNIPLVLCKKRSNGQWLFGKEAYKCAQAKEGILVENIYPSALKDETVTVDMEEYHARDLLALFVKRSFSLLPVMTTPERVAYLVITVRNADAKMVGIIQNAIAVLKIKPDKISIQSYEESFFYYMLFQQAELQNHQVLVCELSGKNLWTYRLERNHFVKPAIATVDVMNHEEFVWKKEKISDYEKDQNFLNIISKICDNRIFSGVYLIGEGFYDDWCRESLKFLCKNRRVFKGNNLFSKGACFSALEKADPTGFEENILFFGHDKLKTSLGVKAVTPSGKEEYIPVLEAGYHWYEAANEVDFILQETDTLLIAITPVSVGATSYADFKLSGLLLRKGGMTRVKLEMKMLSETRVCLHVKDLGFGEIFPSSMLEWTEELDLGQ